MVRHDLCWSGSVDRTNAETSTRENFISVSVTRRHPASLTHLADVCTRAIQRRQAVSSATPPSPPRHVHRITVGWRHRSSCCSCVHKYSECSHRLTQALFAVIRHSHEIREGLCPYTGINHNSDVLNIHRVDLQCTRTPFAESHVLAQYTKLRDSAS